MIVRIEAFIRRIWRVFSPYEWMRRLLNLPKTKDASSAPGLVIIQIDGLSMTQFERTMQKGNMPFLSRLLKKESYKTYQHYSGIPSNTPAVQGRLFYNVKSCVPAFSFKDHKTGKVFNMFSPEGALTIENRIKDQGEPLLKDGSAYGNIFTGGAKEAHFCASSMGWGNLLGAVNPLGVPLTILLNFHIFIRAIFLGFIEIILSLVDTIRGVLSGKRLLGELSFIPFRVGACIVLREIIAAGAQIDISRGLPIIHINLGGYDEQAHHRGPKSAFAHWSLRGIDGVIKKVWKSAKRSPQREYEVFIYSDHGQEETIAYQSLYGRSIEAAVNEILKEEILSSHGYASHTASYWRARALQNKSQKKPEVAGVETKETPPRAIVAAMGPVGHIYLPKPLSAEEQETIALELLAKAKVPIVMRPHGTDQAIAWNPDGRFVLPEEAEKVMDPLHPFLKEVVRDLVELCHHPDSGELILLGWRKGFKSITFHTEQGSHAGPGPEETRGFALLPIGALPRHLKDTVYTRDLRDAAFRAQGRANADAGVLLETPIPAEGAPVLRVMTYNVHHCMGRDGKISPNRIAAIIARHDPDIIALQELDTTEHMHQAEVIAKKLAMTFHFHPSLAVRKGHRGNAIFSKFPIRLVRNGNLPRLSEKRFLEPILEPRGALWVEIEVRGKKVQVFNTHLSLSAAEGLLQIKALCGTDWIGNPECVGPVVFCGDLNSLPGSKICKQLGQTLKNTHFELANHRPLKTLPSFYPLRLIDHVFVGSGIQTTKIQVPRTILEKTASDHLPLIVDIQID